MKRKVTIKIKNMCCDRCIMAVTGALKANKFKVESVRLGEATYFEPSQKKSINQKAHLIYDLKQKGFELIIGEEEYLVEQVKIAVIELVNELPKLENKDISIVKYLQEKIDHNYREVRTVFSKHKKMTIEKYFILQRIEKVKELIDNNELNFIDIADCMGYKATQHLAGQFKRITKMTMNQYKTAKEKNRKGIDQI